MKKSLVLVGALVFGAVLLGKIAFAEYDLEIDEKNNEVYLVSGDFKIALDSVDDYLTGLDADLNLGLISTGSSQDNTGSTEGTGTDSANIGTGTEINSGAVVETGIGVVDTGTTVDTGSSRVLGENAEVELLSGDEFDKALYRMYKNGLTKYDVAEDYRPHDNLTREESAKMIGQLYSELGFTKEDKGFNCSFVDTNMFDPTLAEHIYNTCRRGIFRGNDQTQQFMPRNPLTKGQLLAVLLRIFEGKMSDESGQPRWIEYYIKGMTIGLTNEINLAKFDQPVSRWEAALLIFRFKNMVLDEELYKIYLIRLNDLVGDAESFISQLEELKAKRGEMATQGGEESTQAADTTNPDSNGITAGSGSSEAESSVSLDIIAGNEALTDSPEFMEAINWMYDMGMTSYNTTESFMPYQTITRAQVAKMLDKFASATDLIEIRNFGTCEFSDVSPDSEFKDSITRVCQYGIMAGSNDKFSPDQIVSKAEFVAMLIRLFDGKTLDESLKPRWTAYYKRAIEIGLIGAQDTVTFTSDIARYEVATYLYRLKVRLTMYNNLNSSQLSDEIVKTLDETQEINEEGKITAKVYVDILALNNSAFTDGYVEVLGERYRIKKAITDSYNVGANSFVWYGILYDIENGESIGSISFILTNGALVEGTIRINKIPYYLTKDSNTTTYYNLTQR